MDSLRSVENVFQMQFKSSSYQRNKESNKKEGITTLMDIALLTGNKLNCIHYLMEHGVLAKFYDCPKCGGKMNFVETTSAHSASDGYIWQCRRSLNGVRHQCERSIRKGSFISESNLTIEELLKSIYLWTRNLNQVQVKYA
jgi:hypothetical protein